MAQITINHNPENLEQVDLIANVPFSCPGGEELAMQIVKPRFSSGGKGFPLVVFIQGSAWTKPNQFWQIPQLSVLAKRGYVIASVTHRSCFTAPAPAFLQDVKTAIRFLRAHAAEYDIDKERVCSFGTSSGGNTSLLLGLTGDDPAFVTDEYAEESSAVKVVVDCFGPTDLIKMMDVQYADIPQDEASLFLNLGGGMETIRSKFELISPIRYVKPGLTLPPFLILHGDADEVVLYEDSEAFYNKLTECGYEADLVRITNAPHEGSFWSTELWEIIFSFIEKHV